MQGNKVTAKIGGNLNIETLQEKETYEEKNTSAGFDLSWDINLGKFSKPTIGLSANRGTIDSHYRSARGQSGIFAGKGGFDIYVEKNTDLKGAVIASEADKEKNRLSTGTFSFSDLKNEAEYNAKDTGFSAQIKPTLRLTEDPEGNKIESLKVVQALHSTPSIPTVVQGSADSTTKAAVALGTIDIRENKAQDISALSRDTANALNELGRIFDKKSVEEQKELVNVFREEAFRLAHNLPDDGSGRKTLIHAAIGGLISQLAGAGFASGAAGAGLNEALINNLKGLDPTLAQIISGVLGAAAAKAINGDATAGATAAASGTKWNLMLDDHAREVRQKEYESFLKKFDEEYTQQMSEGNPYSEEEVSEALNNLYNYQELAKTIGRTPLASELLDVFLDQNFSGHGIVNVDYTEHGLPVIEFGSGSLVNETLRRAPFNIELVKEAIQNQLGKNVAMPTYVDSHNFYARGADNAVGLGRASAIVTFKFSPEIIEAKITIIDNWDHSKFEAAMGSFLKDAYIVQQSGVRSTFAYKTTYDITYHTSDIFHE